ncbi:class I SAM-dependent methyltransferase [Patescibacteria group bacterium]|nr:class I SAM-dependent methyltransferase [Patescibacteria group bacterium]MBU4023230.1 class I SAM-dependent methyltransferase [Patescibacteria group bacterium]
MFNIENLGQVFTPESTVKAMLMLRKRFGSTLEPSCGDGAFLKHLPKAIGIEIDQRFKAKNILNIDFFDYPIRKKFDTVIGNPPYVRFQDIPRETREKLDHTIFDGRANLYLFFIEKVIQHLRPHGELIFINPRDFLKATSSIKLNEFIYKNGTITDLIDLGDSKVFNGFTPNCIIWRFEKDNFSRKTNIHKEFRLANGQLLFTNNSLPVKFKDIFFVKVGGVSGADRIFTNNEYGNADFVCSHTAKTGELRRMIYNTKSPFLERFEKELINRKIKKFDKNNWWKWGRDFYKTDLNRIYVNAKTRNEKPFFLHKNKHYDGSILAIFPLNQQFKLNTLCKDLNETDWNELGFVCDGRYIFGQRSLENCMLPDSFLKYTN